MLAEFICVDWFIVSEVPDTSNLDWKWVRAPLSEFNQSNFLESKPQYICCILNMLALLHEVQRLSRFLPSRVSPTRQNQHAHERLRLYLEQIHGFTDMLGKSNPKHQKLYNWLSLACSHPGVSLFGTAGSEDNNYPLRGTGLCLHRWMLEAGATAEVARSDKLAFRWAVWRQESEVGCWCTAIMSEICYTPSALQWQDAAVWMLCTWADLSRPDSCSSCCLANNQ